MIELDKKLSVICRVIDSCYEAAFPDMPRFPKFSFTRAMATMWKVTVYSKLSANLVEAFDLVLNFERQKGIELGKQKTEADKFSDVYKC